MKPSFSIITCTWNSANFLAESIQSVLGQDYPFFEYIFVDGGSTDGTLEIIDKVPGNVTLLENVSGGISKAMNAGIKIATGEVIAHLHSDDYYAHAQVLSRVATAFESSENDWLFGRCLTQIDGKRIAENYQVPQYSYRRLCKGNFIPHPSTFVRRSLFARLGVFDESIKYAMDYDLWLRFGHVATPSQLDEHLAVFRCHAGSLSSANRLASFQDDFQVRMRHVGRAPWSIAYHWAHYLVRRNRLMKSLAGEGVPK